MKWDEHYSIEHWADAFQLKSISEEKKEFENDKLSFSTDHWVVNYWCDMLTAESKKFSKWLHWFSDLISSLTSLSEHCIKAELLLKTWKDIFIEWICDMSATDLMKHWILTY